MVCVLIISQQMERPTIVRFILTRLQTADGFLCEAFLKFWMFVEPGPAFRLAERNARLLLPPVVVTIFPHGEELQILQIVP